MSDEQFESRLQSVIDDFHAPAGADRWRDPERPRGRRYMPLRTALVLLLASGTTVGLGVAGLSAVRNIPGPSPTALLTHTPAPHSSTPSARVSAAPTGGRTPGGTAPAAGSPTGAADPCAAPHTICGRFTLFPLPFQNAEPHSIVTGWDGNLWFTEGSANRIGRMNTAGVVLNEWNIPTANASAVGITPGTDGNMWFTEQNSGKIARITTSGAITEVVVSTPGAKIGRLTPAPDGRMWFSELWLGRIGAITKDMATVSHYSTGSGSLPDSPIPGPDGNIWFADGRNYIGALSLTGTLVHRYPVPTADTHPIQLARAADGTLWFSEYQGTSLASVTTAGVFHEYKVGDLLWGCAIASDGGIWTSGLIGSTVYRLDPVTHEVSTFKNLGPGGSPKDIVFGPDNKLWFTQSGPSAIGRVS